MASSSPSDTPFTEGDYAHIVCASSVHPDRACTAERAIRSGAYEEHGARDDGAMVLLTHTTPPMVLVARVTEAGKRPDLVLLHAAEIWTGCRAPESAEA